jgi:hypothetical protein
MWKDTFTGLKGWMENSIVHCVQSDALILIICLATGKFAELKPGLTVLYIYLIYADASVDVDTEDELVKSLKYDGFYNLAVCVSCRHGLPLEWITKHFKDVHKLSVPHKIIIPAKASLRRRGHNGWMNGWQIMR